MDSKRQIGCKIQVLKSFIPYTFEGKRQIGYKIQVLLIISLYVTIGIPGGAEKTGVDGKINIPSLIKELDSPYNLRRARARTALEKRGGEAVPHLVEGFEEATPQGKTERLGLLLPLVYGNELNALALQSLVSDFSPLRRRAIAYLAAHPGPDPEPLLGFGRELLAKGSVSDIEAYLAGIRKPSPPFQSRLLVEHLPRLPENLARKALAAIRKGWRASASACLSEVILTIQRGRISPDLLLDAMQNLGEVAGEEASPAFLSCLASSSLALRAEAARAARQALGHLFRARRFDELVALKRRLYRAFPFDREFAFDYADALVQYGGRDPHEAPRFLDHLAAAAAAGVDTAMRIQAVEADMGRALLHFQEDGEWKAMLAPPPEWASSLPESDPIRRVLARQQLLEGALSLLEGGDARPHFLAALKGAPYDLDSPEIDRLFSSRFGLSGLIGRLDRQGRPDDAARILAELVSALQVDGSDYYPDKQDRSSYSDRVLSRIPLHEAWAWINRLGRPEAGITRIANYIASLLKSTHPVNREHLGIAYYYEGLAAMDLGRFEAAKTSVEKGIRVYEELEESAKKAWPNAEMESYLRYCRRERALGTLYLESINGCEGGPARESARLARKAHETAPDFDAPIVTMALVRARRGENQAALDVVRHMEAHPDRLYNLACLHALLGNGKEALHLLARHFAEQVPPRRIDIEKRYARHDPDFDTLRDDPDFKRLVD